MKPFYLARSPHSNLMRNVGRFIIIGSLIITIIGVIVLPFDSEYGFGALGVGVGFLAVGMAFVAENLLHEIRKGEIDEKIAMMSGYGEIQERG